MDSQQVVMVFADLQAKLEALTQNMNQTWDRMGSVDMHLENRYEHEEERYPNRNERDGECGPLIQYEGRNVRDYDD